MKIWLFKPEKSEKYTYWSKKIDWFFK